MFYQGCKRVVVLDIDVHYGNGTAEGFYSRDDVLTISLHMNHGSWGASHPQTGLTDEVGSGKGKGFNINVPLPNGTGDKGYELAMSELVIPAIDNFKPEMIVMTFGQDSSAVSSSSDWFYKHSLVYWPVVLTNTQWLIASVSLHLWLHRTTDQFSFRIRWLTLGFLAEPHYFCWPNSVPPSLCCSLIQMEECVWQWMVIAG